MLNHKLPNALLNGFVFVREVDGPINTAGLEFDGSLELVDRSIGYADRRRAEYPKTSEQLDQLWHAMDKGIIPKIEPMYSDILAVKQRHPK